MTTLAALERKAAQLLDQVDDRRRFHTRVFLLEDGDQLSSEQRATIGPYDQVVIRYYPRGLISKV